MERCNSTWIKKKKKNLNTLVAIRENNTSALTVAVCILYLFWHQPEILLCCVSTHVCLKDYLWELPAVFVQRLPHTRFHWNVSTYFYIFNPWGPAMTPFVFMVSC